MATLPQFGGKNFHVQNRERNWQTSGEKTSEMDDLRGSLCFHIFKDMAQNNKMSRLGEIGTQIVT